jgi:uncharacterized OsmC-like protein
MENTIIGYERAGDDAHILRMDSDALSDIHIDYSGIPKESRGGTSVKLLGASCLYCFAATFASALTGRGIEIKSMKGRVSLDKDKDDVFRTRISRMKITLDVEIDEKDSDVFEKCRKIMERGCLLTYTLEEAIDIEHEIHKIV